MKLESLDGPAPVCKKGITEYTLCSSQLKAMGLTPVSDLLNAEKIPFQQNQDIGNATLKVGSTTVPALIETNKAGEFIASLKNSLTVPSTTKQSTNQPTSNENQPTSNEKKSFAIVGLALLALAALANEFKTKTTGVSGLGAPAKKIALVRI